MRNRQWRFVRPVRRVVQWAVILGLCLLPWMNMHEWTRIYGSFFALDVYGIPFGDPASVFWPMVHGEFPIRLWLGLGVTLAVALLVGRCFCSWLCPYGLLSEYAYAVHHKAQAFLDAHSTQTRPSEAAFSPAAEEDLPPQSNGYEGFESAASEAPTAAGAAPGADVPTGDGADIDDALAPFVVRALILALGIVSSVLFSSPVLQWLSMPGALSLLPLQWWYGPENALAAITMALMLPVGVLVLEMLTGVRLWCKWLCPQAVLLAVAAKLGQPFVHVRWNAESCKCPSAHRPCATACSLGLRSRQQGGPNRGECTQCTACVAVCQCKGAGALRVGLATSKNTLHGT